MLSYYLRAQQQALGPSVRRLAHAVGLSPSYVPQVESGSIATPSLRVLRSLADALGVDKCELVATA